MSNYDKYVVGSVGPNQKPGRTVVPTKDRDSGTYKTGQVEPTLAVPCKHKEY